MKGGSDRSIMSVSATVDGYATKLPAERIAELEPWVLKLATNDRPPWGDVQVRTLIYMWEDGISAAEIGRRLKYNGEALGKNAVRR